MADIVVLGSLNMDLVARVRHIPVPGETILGDSLQYICGGKGANQAVTCAKLGASALMLGSVGRDDHGQKLLDSLQGAGVAIEAVQRLATTTGLAVIAVEDSGNNSIIVLPGANLLTSRDYVHQHKQHLESCQAVIMQLEIPLETVVATAQMAKELGKLVVLDPAPAAKLPDELYANVDIIKPNEIELSHLTGLPVTSLDEAEAAARALLAKGVGQVAVSLGQHGALVVNQSGAQHIDIGRPVKVVDTTAAGDSFTAAMTMMVIEGRSLAQAVTFAVAVSKIVVSRPGAQTSIPHRSEVIMAI